LPARQLANLIGSGVRDGDVCAGNHGLGLIGYGSGDGATVGLCEDGKSAQERDRNKAIHVS
jgi:hypothetical protein